MDSGIRLKKSLISLKSIAPAIVLKFLLGNLYKLFTLFLPINQNKVVYASFRSDGLNGNLEYINNELRRKTGRFSYVFLFGKYRSSLSGTAMYYVQMVRAIYHLATSRYFFVDDYYLPIYMITPRKGSDIIQLWHAAGAFKKFGYSTLGRSFGPSAHYVEHIKIHSNYSKVVVSTEEVIPFYAEAFQTPIKQIYPLGLPRTDYFFETDKHEEFKKRFLTEYPELVNKKLVLYAPTFRGSSHQQSTFDYSINFHSLSKVLGDEYAILVHLHPYMNGEIDRDRQFGGFVYQLDNVYSIEEILTISDLLITDYSSIIFDYSILSRPIAFFASDLASYTKERDFYYRYEEFVPGPIFHQSEELAHWIKQGDYDMDAIAKFKNRFLPGCDGNVTSRVVNKLIDLNE
jgi:CDP-glycerol glycerophosphotransferase (TagB/SpsB family)